MHTRKSSTRSRKVAVTPRARTPARGHEHMQTSQQPVFQKKRQEQMIQMKGAKLRVGTCLHSLTTF